MNFKELCNHESIAFAKWIGNKLSTDQWFIFDKRYNKWYVYMKGHITTEELYQLYIEETTKDKN